MPKKLLANLGKKKSAKGRNVSRRPVVLTAIVVVAVASAFGLYQYDANKVPAGYAAGAFQWCTTEGGACLNAWDGGPWVRVYEGLGTSHNNFQLFQVSNATVPTTWEIKYVGPGPWNGKCIGDAYNNPTNSHTSLDPCPTSGNAGWGTVFTRTACGNHNLGFIFKNKHTGGNLGPLASINGVDFFLDFNHQYCFMSYSPA